MWSPQTCPDQLRNKPGECWPWQIPIHETELAEVHLSQGQILNHERELAEVHRSQHGIGEKIYKFGCSRGSGKRNFSSTTRHPHPWIYWQSWSRVWLGEKKRVVEWVPGYPSFTGYICWNLFFYRSTQNTEARPLCLEGDRILGKRKIRISKSDKGIALSRKSIQESLGVPLPGTSLLSPQALPKP